MTRRITTGTTTVKGNRAYVLALRKACSEALKIGVAAFTAEDEDGDDMPTTVVCSDKLKVNGAKRAIGFKQENKS